jgi:hypothetical protein
MPALTDIPGVRGVLVKVLRVGVDGTDKEINTAEYGKAPEGEQFFITGHENFGRVVEVGPNVPDTIRPGTFVVATVRRPGHSIYDQVGLQDMTTDEVYYVEDANFLVTLPATLREVGVLAALAMRLRGLEVTCYSRRPPPYRNSDLITELGAHYVSSQQATMSDASRTFGPFDIIFRSFRLQSACL